MTISININGVKASKDDINLLNTYIVLHKDYIKRIDLVNDYTINIITKD